MRFSAKYMSSAEAQLRAKVKCFTDSVVPPEGVISNRTELFTNLDILVFRLDKG